MYRCNRLFLFIFFATAALSVRAQSPVYSIKGIVLDSAKHEPLVAATIYIKDMEDSLVLGYALSDASGAFFIRNIPKDSEGVFRIFYTGYARYKKSLKNVKQDLLDFGKIYLPMNSNELGAVTITGERPPIAIRGDTIEFNASSFKTRPNSVLSDLLKKLPGVDVDPQGKVTAGGKSVDKIMLDGKTFFGSDPKIAMQNLPSAIVDKVQITDTKTREEEITGDPASGNTKTINITLKKGMDHGYFGRAYAGYATGKHYDASALVNYFQGKRRISLLGATNNINQIGFTLGEIGGLMGAGNIRTIFVNSSGSFGVNGLQFGGGAGITKSTTAGFNYNDDYGKRISLNLSYFYGDAATDNHTRTARQNILPDSVFYYNKDNESHKNNFSHRVNAVLSYKDSLLRIFYTPFISLTDQQGTSLSDASSLGGKNQLVNQSTSLYTTNQQTQHITNQLNIYRTFHKKGEYLYLNLYGDNTLTDGHDFNKYRNLFYDGRSPSDSADQSINSRAQQNEYDVDISYTRPFTKELAFKAGYELRYQHGLTDKKTYDYSMATGKYSVIDSAYSNRFRSSTIIQAPQVGINLKSDSGKWTMQATSVFNIIRLDHYSFTHQVAFKSSQFFVAPQLIIQHKLRNQASLMLRYYNYIRQPTIDQLLPVTDNTNPLYEVRGNPNLKPTVSRSWELDYNKYNVKSGNSIGTFLEYQTDKNAIANVTTFDDQLRQHSTYQNVNGNKNLQFSLNLSKSKKKENDHWRVTLASFGSLSLNHSFVNDVPYVSHAYNLSFRPSFTYGYKELFEVTPSYRFNYQYSKYDVKSLTNRQNIRYEAGFTGTLYWPDGFTWGTDLTYTRNTDVTPGFPKGYWMWNASIGREFLKGKRATLQLSVSDLLDQHVDINRTITDTYIEDNQTIVLHRYLMLKLIYNLRKAGEKKNNTTLPFFFF